MRTTGTQIVAALLVGALTVLAPDGAMSALLANDSVGARSDAASAAGAAGYVEPVEGASSAPVSALAPPGAVTVTITVVDPFTPVPTIIPIYRFFSPKSGTHFYTPSAEERDIVIARWSDVWQYEGIAYTINPARNTQPLHRFYNRANGSHFYTSSPTERDMVLSRWMNVFQYDGASYPVTPYAAAGSTPVWRFYNVKNGSHFYTASAEEADSVIATWPDIYRLEGIAFWLGQ